MRIGSVLENQKIEKRIAITPETAKKFIKQSINTNIFNDPKIFVSKEKVNIVKSKFKINKNEKNITLLIL